MWAQLWGLLLSLSHLINVCAANFTFQGDAPLECDEYAVHWEDQGIPPYTLTLLPLDQVQTTLVMPANSLGYGFGIFRFIFPVKAGSEIVVIMSDSSGFGSGGIWDLLTVGDPAPQTPPCDTQSPKRDFTFTTSGDLFQCGKFVFQEYEDAVQPIQITGVIPPTSININGTTFILNPPNGSKNFTWIADIPAGTQLIFFMTDSAGRQGGTTSLLTVNQDTLSYGASCLVNSSIASATNLPSFTATSTTSTNSQNGTLSASLSTSQMSTLSASSSASKTSTRTPIAAIVVPVVVVTALLIGAFIWYRRRRRNGGVRVLAPRKSRKPVVDLMKGDPNTPPHMEEVGSSTAATPFLHGRSPSADDDTTLDGSVSSPPDTSATTSQSNAQSGGSSSLAPVSASGSQPDAHAGARRKAAEASVLAPPGHQPSTRFILHTDIEDDAPPPVEEVVELPPQYSERRGAGPAASRSNPQPQVGEPSVP